MALTSHQAPPLPPGFAVEHRGIGEERHVLLDLEGNTFELHPNDAAALGAELLRVARAVAEAEEGVPA